MAFASSSVNSLALHVITGGVVSSTKKLTNGALTEEKPDISIKNVMPTIAEVFNRKCLIVSISFHIVYPTIIIL